MKMRYGFVTGHFWNDRDASDGMNKVGELYDKMGDGCVMVFFAEKRNALTDRSEFAARIRGVETCVVKSKKAFFEDIDVIYVLRPRYTIARDTFVEFTTKAERDDIPIKEIEWR